MIVRAEELPGDPLDVYVGKVSGTKAYIAILCDGKQVAGYVTDGQDTSIWFGVSDLIDGAAPLLQRDGPDLGSVTVYGDSADGQIGLGRESYSFSARPAVGDAGLYECAQQRGRDSFQAGWIVLRDGKVRGAIDSYINGVVDTSRAPRLASRVKIPEFGTQTPHELTTAYVTALRAYG